MAYENISNLLIMAMSIFVAIFNENNNGNINNNVNIISSIMGCIYNNLA